MYMIVCSNPNCGYTGPANEVKRHTDGRLLLRCPRCCRVGESLKITAINAGGGQTFGRIKVQAGGRMNLFKRGAGNKAEE